MRGSTPTNRLFLLIPEAFFYVRAGSCAADHCGRHSLHFERACRTHRWGEFVRGSPDRASGGLAVAEAVRGPDQGPEEILVYRGGLLVGDRSADGRTGYRARCRAALHQRQSRLSVVAVRSLVGRPADDRDRLRQRAAHLADLHVLQRSDRDGHDRLRYDQRQRQRRAVLGLPVDSAAQRAGRRARQPGRPRISDPQWPRSRNRRARVDPERVAA